MENTAVYQCFHIYESLGIIEKFVDYYKEKRKVIGQINFFLKLQNQVNVLMEFNDSEDSKSAHVCHLKR